MIKSKSRKVISAKIKEGIVKKLVVFTIAVILVFGMSLNVFAEEEQIKEEKIELTAENFGDCVASMTPDKLTWGENTVTADGIVLFGFKLPRPVSLGETVVVNIKGSSDGDFRVWLLGASEKTFSNQYKMSDNGFESGSFDKTFALTGQDFDKAGLTEGGNILFKGPTSSSNVVNLTLESVTVYYCSMEDYVATFISSDAVKAKADEARAKVKELYDKVSDMDAVKAGIQAIEDEYITYLSEVSSLGVESANEIIDELYAAFKDLRDEATLASLSDSIKAVVDALEKAKASPNDSNILNECLEKAKEAADHVADNGRIYPKVRAKSEELNGMVSEIETLIAKLTPSDETSTSSPTSTEKADSSEGCGSTLGAAAAIMAVVSVLGCAVVRKKH